MISKPGWQHADFEDDLEVEFARMLDYHCIAWRYKPRTFAVEWDDEGNFVNSYTPAFYLFERDQYVELYTPGQAARKVREVRLLRQNYPEIEVMLLSKNDIFLEEMADASVSLLVHLQAPETLVDLAARNL
jgi:hypothetical protein